MAVWARGLHNHNIAKISIKYLSFAGLPYLGMLIFICLLISNHLHKIIIVVLWSIVVYCGLCSSCDSLIFHLFMFRIWKFRKLIGENPEPAKKIISRWPASCRRPSARQPWICGTSPGCTPRWAAATFCFHTTFLIQWFLRSSRVCLNIGHTILCLVSHEFPSKHIFSNMANCGSSFHFLQASRRKPRNAAGFLADTVAALMSLPRRFRNSCSALRSPWSSTKETKHRPQWFAVQMG